MSTDLEWERWGKENPYFGVCTVEKFRVENLTPESRAEFFAGGEADVKKVLRICREQFDPAFQPETVLDFGCGVGRMLIPFAEVAKQVVGIDVSPSMLQECRKNCEEKSITNIELLQSKDNLLQVTGEFDLIHSYIVFQHISTDKGRFFLLVSYLT